MTINQLRITLEQNLLSFKQNKAHAPDNDHFFGTFLLDLGGPAGLPIAQGRSAHHRRR